MNEICHVEIPSTDLKKSKEFYEKLFNWKVEIVPEMNYAMWTPPAGPAGGFNPVKEPCTCNEGCTLVYIWVESVNAKCKEIESAGGKVIKAKTTVGSMGWYAIIQDTAGAVVAIWEVAK
jgi:predicted enzyme related to lactoylglutathione lyase